MLSIDFASRSSLFMGTCAAPGRRFRRVFSINLSVFQRSRRKSRVENLNEQIACEQALLFGQAKRVSRERASEGPLPALPLARAFSRDSFHSPK